MENSNTNTFTEDGRILQIEYAIKNVSAGGTIIAVACTDGVLMLGINLSTLNFTKTEKIHRVDNSKYCLFSGISSDADQIVSWCRKRSLNFDVENSSCIPLFYLCKELGSMLQWFTQATTARPFGCSLLFCDKNDLGYIVSTDPSGSTNKWKAKCFGNNEEKINTKLESCLNMNVDDTTKKIFSILHEVMEIGKRDSKKFEILQIKDKERFLSHKEVVELIALNK